MGEEDTCVSQAQLDELRAWADGEIKLVQQACKALKELLGERDKFLSELIERNAAEAATNHKQILGIIELRTTELHNRFDNKIREDAAYRERNDIEIRTLREGRSTDKGRVLGQQPFLAIVFAVITALLVTALTNFFFNAGRATEVNNKPAVQQPQHK